MSIITKSYIKNVYKDDPRYTEYKDTKAKFNTKIASYMKYNGQIVDVLGYLEGKDVYNSRYIVKFNDNKIDDNIYTIELDFNINEKNKVRKNEKER